MCAHSDTCRSVSLCAHLQAIVHSTCVLKCLCVTCTCVSLRVCLVLAAICMCMCVFTYVCKWVTCVHGSVYVGGCVTVCTLFPQPPYTNQVKPWGPVFGNRRVFLPVFLPPASAPLPTPKHPGAPPQNPLVAPHCFLIKDHLPSRRGLFQASVSLPLG